MENENKVDLKEKIQKQFYSAIDDIIEEARKEGLSVYQWLENHYTELDRDTVIEGLYENYLDMRANETPSEISGKIPVDFEDYLKDSLKAVEYRLNALKFNKKAKVSGFDKLKKEGIVDDVEGLPKGFGEPLRPEDIEFFEIILNRTKEIIINYLKKGGNHG